MRTRSPPLSIACSQTTTYASVWQRRAMRLWKARIQRNASLRTFAASRAISLLRFPSHGAPEWGVRTKDDIGQSAGSHHRLDLCLGEALLQPRPEAVQRIRAQDVVGAIPVIRQRPGLNGCTEHFSDSRHA